MAPRRNPNDFGPINYDALADQAIYRFQRFSRRTQIAIVVTVLIVGIIAAVLYFRAQNAAVVTAESGSPNMLLGNPSDATPDYTNADNYLMVKPYYVLSYNNSKGTPNWVSWRVTINDLGNAPRKQVFDPDPDLPPGFNVVMTHDYAGSGFDRGHMCPHSDRSANQEMSFSTFVMTNIIPQAPNVNQKAWAQLEDYCRRLVREHNHLYIVSGPLGQGGRGRNGPKERIGRGNVVVPAECWKVVVVVPESMNDNDLANITIGTRVISVEMPNDHDVVGEEWAPYRTSPAAIEQKTGFHFFDRVRPDIAQALRQEVDDTPIPPPRPLGHGRD
jgi:endonuclease G